ncbi:hypothetical protein [Lentzea sp. NPDC059081]|uniref:hypothetical protein n=1 Tax=Lentzea sp. NPDC059081 TaxID=3346719 RepID=UPI0036A22D66
MDDGTEIAYHRWEPDPVVRAHPVPVVLQHGFTANAMVNWADRCTVAALTAVGRTVVATILTGVRVPA